MSKPSHGSEQQVRIGISACLLGEKVRFDGGHQRSRFLMETAAPHVDYVPVCPEVECGLGVPRETMRLVGDPDNPRLVTSKTDIDHTDRMIQWAREKVKDLAPENLCGFIFRKNSPSSGRFCTIALIRHSSLRIFYAKQQRIEDRDDTKGKDRCHTEAKSYRDRHAVKQRINRHDQRH